MPFATIRRVNYNSAQCLNSANVTLDIENYERPLAQLQNLFLHGPGVISGLTVQPSSGGSEVLVSAGAAIDSLGRIIVLSDNGTGQIDGQPVAANVPLNVPIPGTGSSTFTLTIEYAEVSLLLNPGSLGNCKQTELRPLIRLLAAGTPPAPESLVLGMIQTGADGKVAEIRLNDRRSAVTANTISDIQQNVRSLQQRLDEQVVKLSEVTTATETLGSQFATTTADHHSSITELRNQLVSISNSISGLNAELSQQKNEMVELNQRLNAVATQSTTRKQIVVVSPALVGNWIPAGNQQISIGGITSMTPHQVIGTMPINLPNLSRLEFFRAKVQVNLPQPRVTGTFQLNISRTRANQKAETILAFAISGSTTVLEAYPTAGTELIDNELFSYTLFALLLFQPIPQPVPFPIPNAVVTLNSFEFHCIIQ